ncbi:MAG: transporter [Glaciihabitans sp.]|nr:transporter [Glaciihabitans sp.]
MFYRRILYLGQFAAAVILPTWVLISRGLLDDGIGWELLVYIIACPFLSIAMLAVGGVIAARQSVRAQRSVSWLDAGLLSLWYAVIIAYGLWAWPTLAVAVVILAGALVWSSGWQLFRETRARFRGLVAGFEQAAQAPGAPLRDGAPRVIVINPESDNSDQQR